MLIRISYPQAWVQGRWVLNSTRHQYVKAALHTHFGVLLRCSHEISAINKSTNISQWRYAWKHALHGRVWIDWPTNRLTDWLIRSDLIMPVGMAILTRGRRNYYITYGWQFGVGKDRPIKLKEDGQTYATLARYCQGLATVITQHGRIFCWDRYGQEHVSIYWLMAIMSDFWRCQMSDFGNWCQLAPSCLDIRLSNQTFDGVKCLALKPSCNPGTFFHTPLCITNKIEIRYLVTVEEA